MNQRLIMVGVGLVVVLLVVRGVMSRPTTGDEVAVDTTGASGSTRAAGGPTAKPGSPPTPSGPTVTPVSIQLQGTAVAVQRRPLVLLNPSTVRQGSSVGVTGSGFDPGATVDVVVKQQASDQGDAITFIQI